MFQNHENFRFAKPWLEVNFGQAIIHAGHRALVFYGKNQTFWLKKNLTLEVKRKSRKRNQETGNLIFARRFDKRRISVPLFYEFIWNEVFRKFKTFLPWLEIDFQKRCNFPLLSPYRIKVKSFSSRVAYDDSDRNFTILSHSSRMSSSRVSTTKLKERFMLKNTK